MFYFTTLADIVGAFAKAERPACRSHARARALQGAHQLANPGTTTAVGRPKMEPYITPPADCHIPPAEEFYFGTSGDSSPGIDTALTRAPLLPNLQGGVKQIRPRQRSMARPYDRRNARHQVYTWGRTELSARRARRLYCVMWAVLTACSNIVSSAFWMSVGVVAV